MDFTYTLKPWKNCLWALSFIFLSLVAHAAIDLEISDSPDNDLQLTLKAISSAQHSLILNIYDLSSPEIADAIIQQIEAGVSVQILMEGQPTSGMKAAARGIEAKLIATMKKVGAKNRLFEMTSLATGPRRFRFDHAKYTIVDDQALLIGSENYSPTGNPNPGTIGNRGWEVLIHDPSIAKQFHAIFASDSNVKAGDIIDRTAPGNALPGPFDPVPAAAPIVNHRADVIRAQSISVILSPDNSLAGLIGLLRTAKRTIDIEQMYVYNDWGTGSAMGSSPLFQEIVKAAKRGVHVRVLLNDEASFPHSANKPSVSHNLPTIQALNHFAKQNRLPLEAHMINLSEFKAKGMDYIHNKGVLVDGNRVLISSINWNENSVMHNREAAVVVESPDAFNFYENLFSQDWESSSVNLEALPGSINPGTTPHPRTRPTNFDCPDSIELRVRVGELNLSDPSEKSFKVISNSHFQGVFNREATANGCVLSQPDTGLQSSSTHRLYVQIYARSDGFKVFALEGYTPESKIYSIRSLIPSPQSIQGTFRAIVFDASSAAKNRLGEGFLQIR